MRIALPAKRLCKAGPWFGLILLLCVPLARAQAQDGVVISAPVIVYTPTEVTSVEPPPSGQQAQGQQTPTQDLGSIAGTVFSQSTGEPLKEARLLLSSADRQNGRGTTRVAAVTDASGNYQFTNLTPGSYRLSASRQGYVDQSYGETRPGAGATPIDLPAGQNLTKMDFRLIHDGAITGHIMDENGQPMERAQVEILRKYYQNGQMQLRSVGADSTNDLGQYRVFDLPPGRYYLKATPSQQSGRFGMQVAMQATLIQEQARLRSAGRSANGGAPDAAGPAPKGSGAASNTGYAPQFYPGGTSVAQATPIMLKGGDDVSGIDLTVLPVQTHSIQGQVSGLDDCGGGRVRAAVQTTGDGAVRSFIRGIAGNVLLIGNSDVDGGSRSFIRAGAISGETGAFEITDVTPGSYFVVAQCRGSVGGAQPVDVGDADVTGISLAISPGVKISGTLKLEGQAAQSASNVQVWLESQGAFPGGRSDNAVDSDGSFELDNVTDGKYTIRVNAPCGQCYIKSARAGNIDLLTNGLQVTGGAAPSSIDIVYSSDAGAVSGTVTSGGDTPAADARVVLVPDAPFRHSDRYRTTFTDSSGKYQFNDVPPGSYEAFAWEAIDDGEYEDPDVIQQFQNQSQSLAVEENQSKTLDLRVIPATSTDAIQ